MRRRWQRPAQRESASLDITTFLSLMVILVPFLLMTAVFSRMTIIEIESAASEGDAGALSDPLQLRVVLRSGVIEVRYRGQEKTRRIERTPEGEEVEVLGRLADELKQRFPRSQEATILVEPQIPYEFVVQVVDTLRMRLQRVGDELEAVERFPLVALGETPVVRPDRRPSP